MTSAGLFFLSLFWLKGTPVILPASVLAICARLYILSYVKIKKYVKKSPMYFQADHEFIFNDDSINTTTTGDMSTGASTIKYEAVYKVYETDNAFYIFLSPKQALLLTKKDIVAGTSEELRKLLQSKIAHEKYILCD